MKSGKATWSGIARVRRLLLASLPCLLLLLVAGLGSPWANAEPQPLAETELADVSGRDGIGFAVHLEINSAPIYGLDIDSRLTAGFTVDGLRTYLVAPNPGGIIDLFAMSLNLRTRPGGGDYIDVTLPFFVGVQDFGVRALSVQTDPRAPITNSYGQFLLNGHASMQGHLYLWAQ